MKEKDKWINFVTTAKKKLETTFEKKKKKFY